MAVKTASKKKAKRIAKTPPAEELEVFETSETDPRRISFGAFYTDPLCETWGNGYRSAIKAGFSKAYAKVILTQGGGWVSEILNQFRKKSLLEKARRNLDKHLDLVTEAPILIQGVPMTDEEGNVVKLENHNLLKIQQNASLFVLETLDEDFKRRDGKNPLDGMPFNVNFNFYTPPADETNNVPRETPPITVPFTFNEPNQ